MISYFNNLDNKIKGLYLAFFGVLLLTPDTLFMRLSELEKWQLGGWRGVLMGATLFLIWFLSRKMGHKKEFLATFSIPGLLIILAMAVNSVSFTLGISETSVIVVLTALATMPLLTALLSVLLLKEKQNLLSWFILIFAVCGISLAVSGSESSENAPNGSVILGGHIWINFCFRDFFHIHNGSKISKYICNACYFYRVYYKWHFLFLLLKRSKYKSFCPLLCYSNGSNYFALFFCLVAHCTTIY